MNTNTMALPSSDDDYLHCKNAIILADVSGDQSLNRDPEYLLYLQHFSPDLRPFCQYEELPGLVKETFRIFSTRDRNNQMNINVKDAFRDDHSPFVEDFCQRTREVLDQSQLEQPQRYHRRQQATGNAPNPAPFFNQLFRPTANEDPRPDGGPGQPTPMIGGIFLPTANSNPPSPSPIITTMRWPPAPTS